MSNDVSVCVPKYRRHKGTGQAVVTLDGRDFYLGKFGSAASHKEYRRLTAEWLAAGGQLPVGNESELTIAELLKRYRKFAERYYRPRPGSRTNELSNIRYAVKPFREIYGHTPVAEFGPLALKALQHHLVGQRLSRRFINARIDRIRRVFRWAVSEQLASPSILHGLEAVPGLRFGHTDAPESPPVQPVSDKIIDLTLPHLPQVVADMVRFQRLTGCRPSEVCRVRPCDVDTSGSVWEYRPATHKTQHRGRERVIFIGPRAQECCDRICCGQRMATVFRPRTASVSDELNCTLGGPRRFRAETDLAPMCAESPNDSRGMCMTRPRTCWPYIVPVTRLSRPKANCRQSS